MELTLSEDVERFADRFSLGRDNGRGSQHFLRVKVPRGSLSSDKFRDIARMAEEYGRNGYAEVTNRQSIQLHWIEGGDAMDIFRRLDEMGLSTDKCGQSYPGTRYGDVRNVVVCPAAGLDAEEKVDVEGIAGEINDFFIGNRDFLDMPRKFKISITGCGIGCTKPHIQDLGLYPVEREGGVGFGALIGGSTGQSLPGPAIAKPLGAFIPKDRVFDVTRAAVEIHRDNSNRESKARSRFKWLVREWGVQRVRETIEAKIGGTLPDLDVVPEVADEEHPGIGEQKDGRNYLTVPLIGGVMYSDLMRGIASVAERYGGGEVRTTTHQNLLIPNVPTSEVGGAKEELSRIGVPLDRRPYQWTAMGCPSDFCGKTVASSSKKDLVRATHALESRFGDRLDDLDLKLYISGCVNDCCLASIAHLGLKGRGSGDSQRYDLLLGGGLTGEPELSERVAEAIAPSEIEDVIGALVQECVDSGYDDFGIFFEDRGPRELEAAASSALGREESS